MRLGKRREAGPALLALFVALSCASGPSTRQEGDASATPQLRDPAAEAPSGSPQGTALRTADPAELSKARDERTAVEAAIVFGSPSSLEKATRLVEAATFLKAEDATAYRAIVAGLSDLVYPDAFAISAAPPAPPEGAGAPGPALARALVLLAEAQAGRAQAVPPEAAGSPLCELMPALAVFAADSRDVARRAAEAMERFGQLGLPSILPDLVQGIDAERRGDQGAALGRYAAVLAAAPDVWIARLGSGRALLSLDKAEAALAMLEPLAKARGDSLAFIRPYALALVENGRYDDAESYVAKVLVSDPQDSAFILVRARLLVRSRSFQQALPLLDAYGTVDPSNRLFLLLRSRAAEGLRSREDALRWARRGLALYPDDPELLVATARLLFAQGVSSREEARSLAARAAAMSGQDAVAQGGPAARADRVAACAEAARLLALDAASRYDWKAAAAYLAAASAAAPFEDRQLAATILRESRSYPAALDYAAAWFKEKPDSEAAAEAYVRALLVSGDVRAAQELIARLLPGARSGGFRSTLYFLQSGLQKSDEAALPLLRSALLENADNPEALAALSAIHVRRKDYAKARFYLKQALALAPGDPALQALQAEIDKAGP